MITHDVADAHRVRLLAATFALMVWEKLSLDLVAMLAFSVLLAAGILTPAEAFNVFSNDAAITVACMARRLC